MRKISLCIPTFNRFEMLFESFEKVYDDERIDEIVIVDDASRLDIYQDIQKRAFGMDKIKLFRNLQNQDCYRNKMTAISYAKNEWCILLDSDNIIGIDYLDRLYEIEYWDEATIYTPDFAMPHFDFRAYSGMILNRDNISYYIEKPMLEVCLNAANYFVNKRAYLDVWDSDTDPITSDSIYQCLNWLDFGGNIYIVPNLQYIHRVHDGSHYQNNSKRTPQGFHQSILDRLKHL